MHEDELLRALFEMLQAKLESSNQSRTFYCQTLLPAAAALAEEPDMSEKDLAAPVTPKNSQREGGMEGPDDQPLADAEDSGGVTAPAAAATASSSTRSGQNASQTAGHKRARPLRQANRVEIQADTKKPKRVNRRDDKLVRSDASSMRLDAFLVPHRPTTGGADGPSQATSGASAGPTDEECECIPAPSPEELMAQVGGFAQAFRCRCCVAKGIAAPPPPQPAAPRRPPRPLVDTACTYDSVRSLIAEIKSAGHASLSTLLRRHVFVGVADRHLSLVQWETKLMLVNHTELARELFYQLAIRRFGAMPRLPLEPALPLRDALLVALELPSTGWTEADGNKEAIAAEAEALLVSKAELLGEYFRIGIDPDARTLTSLPELVEHHVPLPGALPLLLLRLASEVDWDQERACFEGVALELASAYCQLPEAAKENQEPKDVTPAPVPPGAADVIQNLLFPAFRHYLVPPRDFTSETMVMQVACLEKLYKVFERC